MMVEPGSDAAAPQRGEALRREADPEEIEDRSHLTGKTAFVQQVLVENEALRELPRALQQAVVVLQPQTVAVPQGRVVPLLERPSDRGRVPQADEHPIDPGAVLEPGRQRQTETAVLDHLARRVLVPVG